MNNFYIYTRYNFQKFKYLPEGNDFLEIKSTINYDYHLDKFDFYRLLSLEDF